MDDLTRPVLFLDLDDVLCLNAPYGGYDVMEAMRGYEGKSGSSLQQKHQDLWGTLFDSSAVNRLRLIDAEFRPRYVLSTSWTRFLDLPTITMALSLAGLEFVLTNLHRDWETQKTSSDRRGGDILTWLDAHPEHVDRWVVLDDELSGKGLEVGPFVVLCQEKVGLTTDKYDLLRLAFLGRAATAFADAQGAAGFDQGS